MLWVLRTGAPWQDMPERDGAWRMVASRFSRGQKACVFQPLLDTLKQQADAAGQLDWQLPFIDSTLVWAHQHAAGAKTGLWKPRREAAAKVASVPKYTCAPKTVASCWRWSWPQASGTRRSFPRNSWPGARWSAWAKAGRNTALIASWVKAYNSRQIRQYVRRHGMRSTIPRKRNEHRTGTFDRAIYRQHNRIERLINRCKQFRRIATRYEKPTANYQAMWLIEATLLWLGFANTP
jgi:transposase